MDGSTSPAAPGPGAAPVPVPVGQRGQEFVVSAPPDQLGPVLAAIAADPDAELVGTGGPRGAIDRLTVRLGQTGAGILAGTLAGRAGSAVGGPAADAIGQIVGGTDVFVETNTPFDLT